MLGVAFGVIMPNETLRTQFGKFMLVPARWLRDMLQKPASQAATPPGHGRRRRHRPRGSRSFCCACCRSCWPSSATMAVTLKQDGERLQAQHGLLHHHARRRLRLPRLAALGAGRKLAAPPLPSLLSGCLGGRVPRTSTNTAPHRKPASLNWPLIATLSPSACAAALVPAKSGMGEVAVAKAAPCHSETPPDRASALGLARLAGMCLGLTLRLPGLCHWAPSLGSPSRSLSPCCGIARAWARFWCHRRSG